MSNIASRLGSQAVDLVLSSDEISCNVFCNICGGTHFEPGPLGRLNNGKPPLCAQCQSLERHRIIRKVWHRVAGVLPLKNYSCLHFAKDMCVDPEWFKVYYHSEYGTHNSLDLQNIDLPDAAFDVIVCNHVLEHVENDMQALRELMRVLSPHGILQIAVPGPLQQEKTEDWGYPDWEQHGHYRNYGADIIDLFQKALPGVHLLSIIEQDSVTGDNDIVFFLSKSMLLAKALATRSSLFFKTLP